jgi:hypothetical protein
MRAAAVALLDAAGPVLVVARRRTVWEAVLQAAGRVTADGEERAGAALVSFLGEPADEPARRATLDAVRHRLDPGAPLVVVDHNRPRRWWQRPFAAAALLARGLRPTRASYPTARELDAAGFRVDCLRLADGERTQIVLARRESQ